MALLSLQNSWTIFRLLLPQATCTGSGTRTSSRSSAPSPGGRAVDARAAGMEAPTAISGRQFVPDMVLAFYMHNLLFTTNNHRRQVL